MVPIKPYKKELDYSYTLGAFPTIELLKARPEQALGVYLHSSATDSGGVRELCRALGVPVLEGDRAMSRASPKENVYVMGVFSKYGDELRADAPHLVLVNPGDMGNLGTILRTAAGFGYQDVALIEPCADRFAPRAVRASMGALFRVRTRTWPSFEDYRAAFPEHALYPFMLTGAKVLRPGDPIPPPRYAILFGNEATGLDDSFAALGESVFIPQTDAVDSLNLTIAAGIGMYLFRENLTLNERASAAQGQSEPQ